MKVRIISAIALLLIISSCAHNKIRKVRVGPRHVLAVEEENASSNPEMEELTIQETSTFIVEENNALVNEKSSDVINEEENSNLSFEQDPEPNEITEEEPKISEDAYREAFKSERHAKVSRNSFIGAFIALLLPGIGTLISLVLFGVGWGFMVKTSRARFITARGEMIEETARKMWLTYLILLGVALLLIAAFILLLW